MNTVASALPTQRRLPIGAEVLCPDVASFRVWAPRCKRVAVVLEQEPLREVVLAKQSNGYFCGTVTDVAPGVRYRYRLDGGVALRPDPVSRSQPEGHDGPSVLVDATRYAWADADWKGVALKGQVVYEMHIGTYTEHGTWQAAARELPWLAELGVTLLEIMPVGEFPGRYGWGYDAVHLFAPTHLYGTPDDMRAFVDRAHALGLGVILDVVYNHCGSVGCFLDAYACEYFTDRYENEWGNAFNFDGDGSQSVREFVLTNVEYWIREFHLDGFRLDATQTIFDASPVHILSEIGERARIAAGRRQIVLIAENEPQHA
ncbi:MAG TPA: alpha-amylase family glycosyl hydrolase, partial [Burkholderiales bacterium]